jgi:hypothetical protein
MGIYVAIQNLASVNSAIKPKLETHASRDANSCWNNKIAFYLGTSVAKVIKLFTAVFEIS